MTRFKGLRMAGATLLVCVISGASSFTATASSQTRADGDVVSITLVDVLPDKAAPALRLLQQFAADTTHEEGCLQFRLVQERAPLTNHFAVFAVWRTERDRLRHLEGTLSKIFKTDLEPLIAGPVDERLYTSENAADSK